MFFPVDLFWKPRGTSLVKIWVQFINTSDGKVQLVQIHVEQDHLPAYKKGLLRMPLALQRERQSIDEGALSRWC